MSTETTATYKWAIGIMLGIVTAVFGTLWANMQSRMEMIEQEHADGRQRLATVEAKTDEVFRRIERIENKIDVLLEQSQRQRR